MRQKRGEEDRKRVGGSEGNKEGETTGGWKIKNRKTMKKRMVGYKHEATVCQEQ